MIRMTHKKLALIRRLKAEGRTVKDISVLLGYPNPNALYNATWRYGLTRKGGKRPDPALVKELASKGMGRPEIARQCRCSETSVSEVCRRNGITTSGASRRSPKALRKQLETMEVSSFRDIKDAHLMRIAMRECWPFALGPSEIRLMQLLWDFQDGLTPTQLAKKMGYERATSVWSVISKFFKLDYLQRRTNPACKKQYVYSLTEKAKKEHLDALRHRKRLP